MQNTKEMVKGSTFYTIQACSVKTDLSLIFGLMAKGSLRLRSLSKMPKAKGGFRTCEHLSGQYIRSSPGERQNTI